MSRKYFIGLLALIFALSFSVSMAMADDNGGLTEGAEFTFSKYCKGKEKGAAAINSNGTVASCWKCRKESFNTRRLSSATYEVDWRFSDVRSLRGYCRSVQPDTLTYGSLNNYCSTADRAGDFSSVWVKCNKDTPFFIYLLR